VIIIEDCRALHGAWYLQLLCKHFIMSLLLLFNYISLVSMCIGIRFIIEFSVDRVLDLIKLSFDISNALLKFSWDTSLVVVASMSRIRI
jgi:hypothetical protein